MSLQQTPGQLSHSAEARLQASSLFFPAKSENEEPEQLDFGSGHNVVLGTGTSSDGRPLFFTVNHGIVTIAPNNLQTDDKSKSVSFKGSTFEA